MKYTKKSKLKKILENEKAITVVQKYNFPCITCPMAAMEMDSLTIGQICEKYGIDDKKLLKDLNK